MRLRRRGSLSVLVLLCAATGLWGSWSRERADVLGSLAGQHLRAGELSLARTELEGALRWQPHDAALWREQSTLLGLVAFLRHDQQAGQAAVLAARRAVASGPADGRNAFALGWALLDAGQTAAARSPFLAALRLDPHNQSYLYALGLRAEAAGSGQEAVEWYRAAWRVYPDGVVREALDRLRAAP